MVIEIVGRIILITLLFFGGSPFIVVVGAVLYRTLDSLFGSKRFQNRVAREIMDLLSNMSIIVFYIGGIVKFGLSYGFWGYLGGAVVVILIHLVGLIIPKRWHFETVDNRFKNIDY